LALLYCQSRPLNGHQVVGMNSPTTVPEHAQEYLKSSLKNISTGRTATYRINAPTAIHTTTVAEIIILINIADIGIRGNPYVVGTSRLWRLYQIVLQQDIGIYRVLNYQFLYRW
jgi:hypothetical protein